MNRDLRLLSASLFTWGIGEGMFLYIQPIYLTRLGANAVQVGGILGLAGVAMTVAHIPAGALADHFGRKAVMSASWVFGLATAWMMYLATSLPVFVLALTLYSLTAFVMSPMSSYVTAARGEWSVGRALTTISASFNGGAILGPVAGGLLAEAFGLRMVYGFAASLFIVSTALILFIKDQPVEPHDDGHRYRALLHNAALGRLLLVVFVGVTAMYLSWPLTPVYLQSQRGLSVSQIGALGSLNALGIVLLNLTLGRATPRLGIIASQGIVAVSVLFLWRGMGLPWFGLGYLLAGGFRTARSLMSALIERIVLPSQMGLAFGLMETLSGVGLAVAPIVAGLLYARQPAAPYPVSLLLLAGSVVLVLVLVPSGDAGLPARPAAQNAGGQRRE